MNSFSSPRDQGVIYTKDGLDKLIDRIKREARRRVKASEVTHCQALEQLSRENGFKSYAALCAAKKALL
jgi:hypothetical protein